MDKEVQMVKASEFFKSSTEKEPTGWEVKKDEDGVYKFYHKNADLYLEVDDINRCYGIEIMDIGPVCEDKHTAEVQLQSEEWTTINLDRVGNAKFAQLSNEAVLKNLRNDESE